MKRSDVYKLVLMAMVTTAMACSPPDSKGDEADMKMGGSGEEMGTSPVDMGSVTERDMRMVEPDMGDCEKVTYCDPSDSAQIVEVDLCTGDVTPLEKCEGSTPHCSTRKSSTSVGDAFCSETPCESLERDVCDPDRPTDIFTLNTCTGALEYDKSCNTTGSGCVPGSTPNADAKCGNICGNARATVVCDPDEPERLYWGDECGNPRSLKERCSGDDICIPGDEGATCGEDTCVPETKIVCDPQQPGALFEQNSCTRERTLLETCDAGLRCTAGSTPDDAATCAMCEPEYTYACDPDDPANILQTDSCTGITSVNHVCPGVGSACTPSGSPSVRPSCSMCTSESELFCDPSRPTEILSRDTCSGEVTVETTCTEVGEGCTPGRLSSDPPRCGNICGSAVHERVCDPGQPSKVFWTNECGQITKEAETCMTGSSCELDDDGEGRCSCIQIDTDCRYPMNVTDYYGTSAVIGIDSCGGETVLEQCDFGARCFQDMDYNNGVAECTRSLDTVQASSPYYNHGCFGFSELTLFKTKLEADCRCRYTGQAGSGAGYANPVTMMQPGNALEVCQPVDRVIDLTWPVPAGSGPSFSAFHKNTSGVKWHGGWTDEINKIAYAAVSWTNPQHRQTSTIVTFDLRTGARTVVSGIYPDPMLGEVEYGSGYDSPNSIAMGPATQPLSAVNAMRIGPDGKLYTFGLGTTGEGVNSSAEIVRVDPATGLRELVWQSQTIERGVNSSPYGQCLRHNYVRQADNTDAYESVALNSRSFAVGPQGQFYMTFQGTYEGNGVIEVSADGSTCRFVSRWGARDFRLTPQDPIALAPADVGTGFTPQYSPLFNPGLIRHGKLHIVTSLNLRVITVDIATGDRVSISEQPSAGYGGMGRSSMVYDSTRNLLLSAGGPASADGAWVDEATGHREPLFADSSTPGTPLVTSVYDVNRSITSWVGTTLGQTNTLGYGPMFVDPDDPDILYFVLVGGALLKFEISTFNNFLFSL